MYNEIYELQINKKTKIRFENSRFENSRFENSRFENSSFEKPIF